MHWGIVVLLGLAVNLDNLRVGMRYGLSNTRIPEGTNCAIALISGAFAGAACAIAHWMIGGGAAASVASVLLLAGLGVYALCGAGLRRGGAAAAADADEAEADEALAPLGGWDTVILGVSLACDCLGASLGLGFGGASWFWLGGCVALVSFLMVGIGERLGARAARPRDAGWFSAVGGALLIVVAAWELIG